MLDRRIDFAGDVPFATISFSIFRSISVSSMTKHLKKGDVAVIHNPGYSGNGHYLALLDISKDGKEVYISNPDVYGGKTGGYNGATKQGWNSISKVCSALNETVDWVKK